METATQKCTLIESDGATMTAPELFAAGLGAVAGIPLKLSECRGPMKCFWCGAGCDESYPVTVGATFHDWGEVFDRRASHQCAGCFAATWPKMTMPGREKPQRPWNYSWHCSAAGNVAMTKAHLPEMRALLLDDIPDWPWAMAIADSGQKHLIYRTPVNYGARDYARDGYVVRFELLRVAYRVEQLRDLVAMCDQISAACGKLAMSEPLGVSQFSAAYEAFGDGGVALCEKFNSIANEPVTRLAAFLAKNKEDARSEYLIPA